MDAIREQLNKPLVTGIAGFIVGVLIGLIVLGWGPLKVKYYDAAPEHLHEGYQDIYLRMAIQSFKVNPDAQLARENWNGLGEQAATVLERVKGNPGPLTSAEISAFEQAVMVALPPAEEMPTEEAAEGGRSPITNLFIIMCAVTLVLGLALLGFYLLQGRRRGTAMTPAMQAQEAARQAEWTDFAAEGEEAPMAQFMASYQIGDDLFDDSFSVDSPSGEFLGECGVGISETIGVGEPKKVAAFEVWLFDKNDIQTVTQVLMSQHAFEDPAVRQRLEAKGEPILATPGGQSVLDTATLRLVARIVDMSYGEGALPEGSFFERMILELAVWPK